MMHGASKDAIVYYPDLPSHYQAIILTHQRLGNAEFTGVSQVFKGKFPEPLLLPLRSCHEGEIHEIAFDVLCVGFKGAIKK
jgi:hypothetical protein